MIQSAFNRPSSLEAIGQCADRNANGVCPLGHRLGFSVVGQQLHVPVVGNDCLVKREFVTIESVVEFQVVESKFASPVLEDQSFPIVCEPEIVFGIPNLNILGRPSAIKWLLLLLAFTALSASVAAECIYSVESVLAGRCLPHVGKERLEGISPSLAHVMSNTTVPAVVVVLDSIAPRQHLGPNGKLPQSRMSMPYMWSFAHALAPSISIQMLIADRTIFAALLTATEPVYVLAYSGYRHETIGSECVTETKANAQGAITPLAADIFFQAIVADCSCSTAFRTIDNPVWLVVADFFFGQHEWTDSISDLQILGAEDSLTLSHEVTSYSGCQWLEPADVSASVPARFILPNG